MRSSVDDVERRNRHHELVGGLASQLCEMLIEGKATAGSSSTGSSERDSEDSVGANFLLAPAPLVLSAVNLFHHLSVNSLLLGNIHALESRGEDIVDVLDSLKAALAKETLGVLITQLECLIDARGSARWNSSPEDLSIACKHVSLNGRVTAGVNDLAGAHGGNGGEAARLDARDKASSGDVAEHFVVYFFTFFLSLDYKLSCLVSMMSYTSSEIHSHTAHTSRHTLK